MLSSSTPTCFTLAVAKKFQTWFSKVKCYITRINCMLKFYLFIWWKKVAHEINLYFCRLAMLKQPSAKQFWFSLFVSCSPCLYLMIQQERCHIQYRTSAIISWGLNIFIPFFHIHFFVFRDVSLENYVFMYSLYSRAVCNQELELWWRVYSIPNYVFGNSRKLSVSSSKDSA